MKRKTLPALIKRTDAVFSKWVRKNEKRCVLCGSTERLQCSHLIRRGKMSVRFDIMNCHTNCASCNYRHNHYPERYTQWFLSKFGIDKYMELIQKSMQLKKWTREELEFIITHYGERK